MIVSRQNTVSQTLHTHLQFFQPLFEQSTVRQVWQSRAAMMRRRRRFAINFRVCGGAISLNNYAPVADNVYYRSG